MNKCVLQASFLHKATDVVEPSEQHDSCSAKRPWEHRVDQKLHCVLTDSSAIWLAVVFLSGCFFLFSCFSSSYLVCVLKNTSKTSTLVEVVGACCSTDRLAEGLKLLRGCLGLPTSSRMVMRTASKNAITLLIALAYASEPTR